MKRHLALLIVIIICIQLIDAKNESGKISKGHKSPTKINDRVNIGKAPSVKHPGSSLNKLPSKHHSTNYRPPSLNNHNTPIKHPINRAPSFNNLKPPIQQNIPINRVPSFNNRKPPIQQHIPINRVPSFNNRKPPIQQHIPINRVPSFNNLKPPIQQHIPINRVPSFNNQNQQPIQINLSPSFNFPIPSIPSISSIPSIPSISSIKQFIPTNRLPSFNLPNIRNPLSSINSAFKGFQIPSGFNLPSLPYFG